MQQSEMFRLTVDHVDSQVYVRDGADDRAMKCKIFGRSAYLCRHSDCVLQAVKNNRLRFALEGRRIKGAEPKRRVTWPLEPQLIKLMTGNCTDTEKTCQNTGR